MDSSKRHLLNILLVTAPFGSWIAVFFYGSGSLLQNGFGSLRYFTMLSNLFVGFVAIAWLITAGKAGKAIDAAKEGKAEKASDAVKEGEAGRRIELLKYVSAASVGLTFATVLFFLGPIYGYSEMFGGANFVMHFVTPVAAMTEIIFLTDTPFTRKDNLMVIIPPLLYGIGYLANILINGIGEFPDTNDWYFFFAWGYGIGAVIYFVLMLVTWLIGFLMRKLRRTTRKA